MGYFNERKDLINSTYVVAMINIIKKYNPKNILDLGQGNQGKTSYYLNLYFGNDREKNITCVVPTQQMKDRIMDELNKPYCDKNIIVKGLIMNKDGNQVYDINWSGLTNYKYNFVSVDAPYISEINGINGRIDIVNIIKANKINKLSPYFIMFHDIDNSFVKKAINSSKELLKCNLYKKDSYVILTNQFLDK